jgi:DME family drug/metabolite transporter
MYENASQYADWHRNLITYDRIKGYGFIIFATGLWASQGVFYTGIRETYELPSFNAAFFRAVITAAFIFGWLALRRQSPKRLSGRETRFFAFYGIFGIALPYFCFASAVDLIGIGIATVLMYTAPLWVTLVSTIMFGERWTISKAVALLLVISGVSLVAQIYRIDNVQLNPAGILAGLGAGVGYAAYTMFNKVGLQHHPPLPLMGYALIFGSVMMLPFQPRTVLISTVSNPQLLFWLTILSLATTLLAGYLFVSGLLYLPASNASITTALEPAIALALGAVLFGEGVSLLQLVGAGLITAAVLLLKQPENKQPPGSE